MILLDTLNNLDYLSLKVLMYVIAQTVTISTL